MNTEIIVRDELAGKSFDELQEMLTANCTEAEAEVATMGLDEIKAAEQELMEVFKENDARMETVAYTLPAVANFENIETKASDVQKMIIEFLNRLEVEWKASLGIYQAIRFWKTITDNVVPYAVYDSTLRLLGTLKFKGERDCLNILTINNYMSAAHAGYIEDNTYMQYLAARHQVLMSAMEKLEKAPETEEVNE